MYLPEFYIKLLIAFLLPILLIYWPVRRQLFLLRRVPGPSSSLLIAKYYLFQWTLNHMFVLVDQYSLEYNKLFKFWFGPKALILLADPAAVQVVLSNKRHIYRDSLIEGGLTSLMGSGLLTNRDDEWRIHRRMINPLFYYQNLKSYTEIFAKQSQLLVDDLSNVAIGTNINIYPHIQRCTTDALCESILGIKMDSTNDDVIKGRQLVQRGSELAVLLVSKPWLQLKWINQLFAEGREVTSAQQFGDKFIDSTIAQKREAYRSAKHRDPAIGVRGEERGVSSLLDELIEAAESEQATLSMPEVRGEMMHLIAAGFDTVTVALSTLLVLMGIHPDVQDKVARELDGIFGSDPRLPTADDLSRMDCLERVIKESMRMFPVVHFYPRELVEDVRLPCGRVLPRGATAVVFSYRLHRDERSFPEPDRFLPDRWLPDRVAGIHPYAYLPFSAGPRNCIGQKYAKLIIKAIASSVLRRFTISTRLTMEDMRVLDEGASVHLTSGNYEIQLKKRTIEQ